MPLFLITILGFTKKYWIYIVITLAFISYTGYIYHLGYSRCEAKMNAAIVKEIENRDKRINEINEKYNNLLNKVRSKTKLTDEEMSCILSGNPFDKECIQ